MGKDSSHTYLVSGSSRGVGLELVKALLSDYPDSIVVGGARSPDKYKELKELSERYKDRFHILKLDISSAKSVQEAAKTVEKWFPDGLDYVINNAGTSEDIVPPLETPDDDLSSVMQTNAVGPIFMFKYFEKLLEKGTKKTLINTASNFGSLTLASEPLKKKTKAYIARSHADRV